MPLQHKLLLFPLISRKVSGLQENNTDLDCFFLTSACNDKIFAASTDAGNAGGSGKRKQVEEIKDESGLGSGAGVTSDEPVANIDPSESTGPGGNRKGDKMPGEDGITSITDSIADAIDRAQDDDSTIDKKS
jgi:hypothetical protein